MNYNLAVFTRPPFYFFASLKSVEAWSIIRQLFKIIAITFCLVLLPHIFSKFHHSGQRSRKVF
jgi:hypothetical protein